MNITTAWQIGHVRTFVRDQVGGTTTGQGWLALAAPHWPEILGRLAASTSVWMATQRALREAARLVASESAGWQPVIDERSSLVANRLLDELGASASPALRGALAEFRRDLDAARGRRVADVLHGTGPTRRPRASSGKSGRD